MACSKTEVSGVSGSGLAARRQCRELVAQGLQQDSSVGGHWLRACSKTEVWGSLAQGLQQDKCVGVSGSWLAARQQCGGQWLMACSLSLIHISEPTRPP